MQHPTTADGVSVDYLNGLMTQLSPDVRVTGVRILESMSYGQQFVSTTARVIADVDYAPGAPAGLPGRLVIKLARGVDKILAPLYANEVAFYRRLRPEVDLEAPRVHGADYDDESGSFALVMEDLTLRGAVFPNVTMDVGVDAVKAVLATQAKLHAHYWQTPRFKTDLSWVETHLEGPLAYLHINAVTGLIQHEIDTVQHKREMVQRLRTSGPQLREGMLALHRHQQTLPQTIVEGDMHVGNTYLLPDGTAGLTDWQLMCRSHHMHDVSYLITTALSVGERRAHEAELLRFYLDRLGAEGVATPPSFEDSWNEYRRCLVWGVYIGWMTTPVVNYGWQINVMNLFRLTTAYEDHETTKAVAEVA